MFRFAKNIVVFGLLTISYTAMAEDLLNLSCIGETQTMDIDTVVTIQEKSPGTSREPFLVTITRNHKYVSAGHMLGHGGLGIDKMGNYKHLYLYTGYDLAKDPQDWKPGSLNASEFGLQQQPVVCKKLEGINQDKNIIPDVPCGGRVDIYETVSTQLKKNGSFRRNLVVSYQVETSAVSVSNSNGLTTVGSELTLKNKEGIKISLVGKSIYGLEGAMTLPTVPSVNLTCTKN